VNTIARFWLFLTAFYFLANGILSVLVWNTIDLRLEVILQHTIVPFLQAVSLAWVIGAFSLKKCVIAAWRALFRPLVAILWCSEGVLLFSYWMSQSGTDLTGMVARTAGVVAIIAVVILLIRVFPKAGFRKATAILPFAIIILALGSNAIRPWFSVLPVCLPEGWPFLLRQAVVVVATVVALLVFTGKAQGVVSTQNPLAGLILGWSQLFFIVAVMALTINGYLYSFLASPWLQIIVTSLSMAAACLLTTVVCLLPGIQDSDGGRTFIPLQKPLRPKSFLGSYFVLILCAFTCLVILRVLFFPQWDWSARALLSLSFIPLMQTSWLRWVQELRENGRFVIRIFKKQFVFFPLIIFEITLFGFFGFSKNLWDFPVFPVIVSAWVGLKLVILGAVILNWAFHGIAVSKFKAMCGAVTLILGMGIAFTGGFSALVWLFPSLGCTFALMGVWRGSVTSDHGDGLAMATAEALVMPLLSISFCILMTHAQPMVFVVHGGQAMAAIATTFLAMFLNSLKKGSETHQEI